MSTECSYPRKCQSRCVRLQRLQATRRQTGRDMITLNVLCIAWASFTLHDSCRSDAVTRLFHHQRPAQDERFPLSQSFRRAAQYNTPLAGTKGRGRFSADALCEAKLCYAASANGAFFAVSSLKAFNAGGCDASDPTLQPLKPRQYLCAPSHATPVCHVRVSVKFHFIFQG